MARAALRTPHFAPRPDGQAAASLWRAPTEWHAPHFAPRTSHLALRGRPPLRSGVPLRNGTRRTSHPALRTSTDGQAAASLWSAPTEWHAPHFAPRTPHLPGGRPPLRLACPTEWHARTSHLAPRTLLRQLRLHHQHVFPVNAHGAWITAFRLGYVLALGHDDGHEPTSASR